MTLLKREEFVALIMNYDGDDEKVDKLIKEYGFENYKGEPATLYMKIKIVLEALETLSKAIDKTGGEFIRLNHTASIQQLTEVLNDNLEYLADRRRYYKEYYKQHKGE